MRAAYFALIVGILAGLWLASAVLSAGASPARAPGTGVSPPGTRRAVDDPADQAVAG